VSNTKSMRIKKTKDVSFKTKDGVSDYGIFSKCFLILGKMPTERFY
jgi:hypothetical protein